MIPHIIHQIYWDFSGNNKSIPKEWEEGQYSWKKIHPDWKYKLWNDKDCLELLTNYYKWFLPIYNNYKYEIQRCDSIRPFILYHYGGLYADMDTLCVKSFNNILIEDGIYILENWDGKIYNNGLMASSKNHDFWKIVMEDMIHNKDKKWYQFYQQYILQSTGPKLLNKSLEKYTKNDKHMLQKETFNKCGDMCNTSCDISDNRGVYVFSIDGKSWWNSIDHLFNIIRCKHKLILIIISVFLVLIIIFKYK